MEIGTEEARVVKQCWDAVSPHLPTSDPSDPRDPSVNLSTLATIALAKWKAADDLLAEIRLLEREVERAEEWHVERMAPLLEALGDIQDRVEKSELQRRVSDNNAADALRLYEGAVAVTADLLAKVDLAERVAEAAQESIADMLDVASGWCAPMLPEQALTRITEIGKAAHTALAANESGGE